MTDAEIGLTAYGVAMTAVAAFFLYHLLVTQDAKDDLEGELSLERSKVAHRTAILHRHLGTTAKPSAN